jgi:hypothetical protein
MLVASVDVRFQGKAGEVGAVSRKRVSALGRPAPASSARSHHITWFVIPGSALGGQNQLHDLLDIFLHRLKFAARQIELSPCSRNLGVGSDGRYVFQVYMNRFAAGFGQSDPNPRSARDPITTEGGALYDAEL